MHRQPDVKFRSLSRCGLDLHSASGAPDDAEDGEETESGASVLAFGREKRLENVLEISLGDASAVVCHPEFDIIPSREKNTSNSSILA